MADKKIAEMLKVRFEEVFGEKPTGVYFAPGRVNLIGEYTDFNGGHVFPCALTLGTYAAARRRDDTYCRFASLNIDDGKITEFDLADPALGLKGADLTDAPALGADDWTNYPKGVIWAFSGNGYEADSGMDILFYGDIPAGSGLSSSASLEVLTGLVLRDLFKFDVTQVQLATFGQMAENGYVGMNCGIMDQFASAMGSAGKAILLDTNTLEYEYAPLELKDMRIVIINSNVHHQLASSAYNTRRAECEEAFEKAVRAGAAIDSLCDIKPEEFEKYSGGMADNVMRRARHAVTEDARTLEAVPALKAGDVARFGELMNASHVSLRDDFESSCPELDFIAEEAWKHDGVVGCRITGGGFGGCAVAIVRTEAIPGLQEDLARAYEEKWNKKPEFYVIDPGEGAHVIEGA